MLNGILQRPNVHFSYANGREMRFNYKFDSVSIEATGCLFLALCTGSLCFWSMSSVIV